MIKQLIFAVVLLFGTFTVQAAETIDINTADVATIEQTLVGIGAHKAQAIVKYRQEHGPYKSVEDLVNVSGVGEKTLEKIRAQIRVSSAEKTKN